MNQATQPKGKSIYDILLQVAACQDTIIDHLKAGLTDEATKQLINLNQQLRNLEK
jgi:hypothetical protein